MSANFLGVVMNADGQKRNISRILAFKLGGDAELPAMPDAPPLLDPPDLFGSEEQVTAGGADYMKYCAVCHGVEAIGGGAVPDLRNSAMIATEEAFRSVVLDGTYLDKGMASFSEVLDEEAAEAVRAYIVQQAHQ